MARSLSTAIKAARQLGIPSLYNYARYQVGLYSGYYRWKSSRQEPGWPGKFRPILNLPTRPALLETLGDSARVLIEQAEDIVQGRIGLFGSEPVPLQLVPPGKLDHWTAYEKGKLSYGVEDIKIIWEPARFGWAFTLGRAYVLTGDERYAQAFWEHTETFTKTNPPYLGPNWLSGQEAALRIFAFVFAGQVFLSSAHSTERRKDLLRDSIAVHAARLPLTLVYAKAQNNNHLLTEAAGLYTAGLALPKHPAADRWMNLGWRFFNKAVQTQITPQGAYTQHSTNYHRLMLQTLLWVSSLSSNGSSPQPLPYKSRLRGAAASRWLMALLEPSSGRVPNLGPNDGAYILPFTTCPFNDFRPVLQAAAFTFLGFRPFPSSPVDEMSLWLGREASQEKGLAASSKPKQHPLTQPHILRSEALGSWAYLRAARFTSRPGHADQLHLDLWWRGENIALDPGTFSYNARPPWDNSLARTEVHNTIGINQQDQMARGGRFLWLDWAQARILEYRQDEDGSLSSLTALHDGYRSLGILHRRKVTLQDGSWQVQDELLPTRKYNHESISARLHWLLPDWPWQILDDRSEDRSTTSSTLKIQSGYGWIQLSMLTMQDSTNQSLGTSPRIQLVRAGELLHGTGEVSPTWGWFSPTYNKKIPALSFSLLVNCRLPVRWTSNWVFPHNPADGSP